MSLRDYVAVIRRRKWIVIAVVLVLMAGTAAFSLQQSPLYRGEAQVLLNTQDVTATLSGTPLASSSTEASRVVQTQADLARAPVVMNAAVQAADVPISPSAFRDQSSVTASPDSDLLDFQVDFDDPTGAQSLALSYARAFVSYRENLDTSSIRLARRGVEDRLRELAESGDEESTLYQKLASKSEELKVLSALQTSHAVVVKTAGDAPKVQPLLIRNLVIAGVAALVVGMGLALARDALDTSPRSALEIAQRLGLPLLGRIPRSPFRNDGPLVMFEAPDGPDAEPFRILRANLDHVEVELGFHSVIMTSALQGEEKSTTIANLAIASARSGRDVILVDLDLRSGDVDRLFGVTGRYGITDIARGAMSVGAALIPISIGEDGVVAMQVDTAVSATERAGRLRILPAGTLPPAPGDLALSDAVADILDELNDAGDLVIVDVPPLLQAGDALAISALVDAVIVVARIGVRAPTLDELNRALARTGADKLGVVVTGGTLDQGDYPGYYGPVRPAAGKRPLA